MFEKILVCLDGSKFAEHILPYAMELSRQFDRKIVLLRVLDTFPGIVKTMGEAELVAQEPEPVNITNNEAEAMAYLEGLVAYLEEKELKAEGVIIKGTPDEAIVSYARQHDIGLIAMVTHGHSSLGRVVSGSITDDVLKKSGIPVLAIRPGDFE
jgi:nucleotide-binding universal stress UspA family protein